MPVSDVGADAWTLIDLVLGLGLLVSMLLGAWRGLVMEIMALLAWLVGYVLAQWWGLIWLSMCRFGATRNGHQQTAGMLVVFVLTWVGWALVAWSCRKNDRCVGAQWGPIARWGRYLGCCAGCWWPGGALVSLTPWLSGMCGSRHVLSSWLNVLLKRITPLPEQVVKFLPEQS